MTTVLSAKKRVEDIFDWQDKYRKCYYLPMELWDRRDKKFARIPVLFDQIDRLCNHIKEGIREARIEIRLQILRCETLTPEIPTFTTQFKEIYDCIGQLYGITFYKVYENVDHKIIEELESELQKRQQYVETISAESIQLGSGVYHLKRFRYLWGDILMKFSLLDHFLDNLMKAAIKCEDGEFHKVSNDYRAGNQQLIDNLRELYTNVAKYQKKRRKLEALIGLRKVLTHEWWEEIGSFIFEEDGSINMPVLKCLIAHLENLESHLNHYIEMFINDYRSIKPKCRLLPISKKQSNLADGKLYRLLMQFES